MFTFSWRRAMTVLDVILLGVWARYLAIDTRPADLATDVVFGLWTLYLSARGIAEWREDGPE